MLMNSDRGAHVEMPIVYLTLIFLDLEGLWAGM